MVSSLPIGRATTDATGIIPARLGVGATTSVYVGTGGQIAIPAIALPTWIPIEPGILAEPEPAELVPMSPSGTDALQLLSVSNPGAARRIRELAALSPDWDGAGAWPPTNAAVQAAAGLLVEADKVRASRSSVDRDLDTPTTFVAPLPDGGLQIEWGPVSDRKLVVEVDPSGREIEFVYIDEQGVAAAVDGSVAQASDIEHYLRLILG